MYFEDDVHAGIIEATSSWLGKPSTNAAAGWDVTSAKPDRQSTSFYKWDISAAKGMASVAVT